MDHIPCSTPSSPDPVGQLCRQLLALARREEALAAEGALRLQYWQPRPPDVVGHREAARALREEISRLEARTDAAATTSNWTPRPVAAGDARRAANVLGSGAGPLLNAS